MKVRTSYRDGLFWMTRYTNEHKKAGVSYVEIGEQEWERWEKYVSEYRQWQDRLTDLDGIQYEKDRRREMGS